MRYSANLNIIIKAIEKATVRTPRDFMELENLQTSPNSANKFTNACYNQIKKILADDLERFRAEFNIIFSDGQKIIKNKDAEYTYIVFPLDGINNLTRSNPDFTVAIALVHKNEKGEEESISVAIKKIVGGELYYCEKGFGAFLNNRRIRISKRSGGSDPIVAVSEDQKLLSEKLKGKSFTSRNYGCKTMEIAYMASARIDYALLKKQNYQTLKPFLLLAKEAGAKIIEEQNQVILTN